MRIGFDAGPIVGGAGGIRTHTFHLLQSLLRLGEDLEVFAYIPTGSMPAVQRNDWASFSRLHWIETGRRGMSGRGKQDRLDLFHGPNFKMRTEGRCGGVVTIHDLWMDRHPEYSGKLFGQWWSRMRTKRTAWRAKKVITVSQFSAGELMELYGLPPARVVVIPNGIVREFWEGAEPDGREAVRKKFDLPELPYILFVGGADPRKNHRTFLQAFAGRREDLREHAAVLVGDPTHRFGSFRETARLTGLTGKACFTGRVGPDDLKRLYREADVFVFPSLYEGFGIPVLEAMACGTPVITSSGSSLQEVAGDAACLVDPHDAAAMGQAMVTLARDQQLRERLRAEGFLRVKQFDWMHAASKTLALYRELCA